MPGPPVRPGPGAEIPPPPSPLSGPEDRSSKVRLGNIWVILSGNHNENIFKKFLWLVSEL